MERLDQLQIAKSDGLDKFLPEAQKEVEHVLGRRNCLLENVHSIRFSKKIKCGEMV